MVCTKASKYTNSWNFLIRIWTSSNLKSTKVRPNVAKVHWRCHSYLIHSLSLFFELRAKKRFPSCSYDKISIHAAVRIKSSQQVLVCAVILTIECVSVYVLLPHIKWIQQFNKESSRLLILATAIRNATGIKLRCFRFTAYFKYFFMELLQKRDKKRQNKWIKWNY